LPLTVGFTHVLATKCVDFQCEIEQKIQLNYINIKLQIRMVNWREVYLLKPQVVRLIPEVDKGRLVYRAKGAVKRISYNQLKRGLIKKPYVITEEVPSWLMK
jgi:hypothetical protein